MRPYVNKAMEDLARELSAGLVRLRKGYIDAAEPLTQIIDPAREYPYEFVVFRLTGFRPPSSSLTAEPLPGKGLRADLLRLMIDVCDSFELKVSDYAELVYDIPSLARAYKVSTKTIQRWRRRGLPARRLVLPGGKRQVAFLESSVKWFVEGRLRSIQRSMSFSQTTAAERDFIIRRAHRMAAFTHCSLSEVARRLAARTGRAVETIRYIIRNHDRERPEGAIFADLLGPLGEQEKMVIYRCFLRGVQAPALAQRYHRTRGSIYRIVNEMRARQLLARPINYVYNAQFDLPNADEIILSADLATSPAAKPTTKPPPDLPPYLGTLYEVPLLDAQTERNLFRKYNYLKHKADRLRRQIDVNHIRTSKLKGIESLLLAGNAVKNQIIRANLRLVVSISKKHTGGGPQTLFELISDGNVSLMQAVEKFDFSRGNRFSTYASWAIIRNFARSVPREKYQLDRFATGQEEVLDIAAGLASYNPDEVRVPELRESIDVVLAQLSPRERMIVMDHYGLDQDGQVKTLDQLGRRLGLSKERVRQIEIQALRKLRAILKPQEMDLLT